MASISIVAAPSKVAPFGKATLVKIALENPSSTNALLLHHARAQGDEKLVQLREGFGHSALHPGDGSVESVP